jgi:hypothetical protein
LSCVSEASTASASMLLEGSSDEGEVAEVEEEEEVENEEEEDAEAEAEADAARLVSPNPRCSPDDFGAARVVIAALSRAFEHGDAARIGCRGLRGRSEHRRGRRDGEQIDVVVVVAVVVAAAAAIFIRLPANTALPALAWPSPRIVRHGGARSRADAPV